MTEDAAAADFASFAGNEGSRQIKLPRQSVNQQYFQSVMLIIRTFDIALGNLTRVDDPRPKILARQIINRVLDDTIKYKLIDAFDRKLSEIDNLKDSFGNSLSEDRKCEERIKVSQDIAGEVIAYMDEYIALHKGQEIGEV